MKPEFKKCWYCQVRDKDSKLYSTSAWEKYLCDEHRIQHEEKERMYANCGVCGKCARCKAQIDFMNEDHIDRVDYRPPWQMSVAEEIEQEEARETVDAMRWSYKKFKQTSAMDKVIKKPVKHWR